MATPAGDAGIADDVRQFIVDNIDSVEHLEVLLLLHRQPRGWTPQQIAAERRTVESAATMYLDDLKACGLVVRDPAAGAHRIVADSGVARTLDRVADAWRERRVAMITLIYTRPEPENEPARPTDPLRAFVDSFRLKGDKKDG